MAVNLTKNQNEISGAWRQVVESKDAQNWALFGYEGNTNNIKLLSTGSNGLKELVEEFNCSLIQYAFCRVIVKETNLNKLVLINWQGESSPLSRKGLCASHVGDVVSYFKGCTQTITIRNDDEATEEYLLDQIIKTSSSSRISLPRQQSQQNKSIVSSSDSNVALDSSSGVSSTITNKKIDINSDLALDRKSFWQRQEEEEKERLLEEKKRAAEKQAQFERERKLREESEAKKLAETIKERDRLIEATRLAERRESTTSGGSQPSSILATNANDDNDDERVGRRSELIRLERNQETLSLIGKGLIKNKRAIFEQASQQPNQACNNTNTTRRGSGAMVTQRLNTFKSLDHSGSTSSNTSVEKLANGIVKHVNIEEKSKTAKPVDTIKREIEAVKITNETPDQEFSVAKTTPPQQPVVNSETKAQDVPPETNSAPHEHQSLKLAQAPLNNGITPITSNAEVDANGNDNNNLISKSPKQDTISTVEDIIKNSKYGTKAKALYDYQAADSTEISFDPDDIIGFIEKVDAGWWHGTVVTGPYTGACGLFPANYVEEL